MRTISYRVSDLKKVVIEIGYVAENEHTRVIIDCAEVFAEYPAAVPSMKVQPPKGTAYPAEVTKDGDCVIWDVKDSDLTERGRGEIQLTFTKDGKICKSAIAKTNISRSIVGSGATPDPVQDWIDEAENVLEALESAEVHQPTIGEDGYWYTWNQENGEYVKSDTKAQGRDGDPGQPGQDGTDATPDLITKDYADLTFPVAKDSFCYHDGKLYQAKHWTETTVEEQLNTVKSDLQEISEPYGHQTEWRPVQINTSISVIGKRVSDNVGDAITKDPGQTTSGLTNSTITSCIINAFICEANKKYRLVVVNGVTPASVVERGVIVIAQNNTTKTNKVVEKFRATNTSGIKDYFEFTPLNAGYVYFNVDANYQSIAVEVEQEVGAGKTAVDEIARTGLVSVEQFVFNSDITPDLTFESGDFDAALDDGTGTGYRSQIIEGVKDCAVCIKVNPDYTAVFGNGTDQLVTVHGSFVYHSVKDKVRLWVSDTAENSGLEVRIYKEKGHRGIYDVIVAASDSSESDKMIADIVCDGTHDEIDLQFAVNWNFCRKNINTKRDSTNVLLLPGNYKIDEFSTKETLHGDTTVAQYAIMVGNDQFSGANGYFYSAAIHGTSDQGHLTGGPIARIDVTNAAISTLSNEVENVLIGVCRAGSNTGGRLHMNGICIEVKNLTIYTNGMNNKIIALDGYTAGGSIFESNDVWSVNSTNIDSTTIAAIPFGSIGIRAGDGSCYGVRQSIKGNRISGFYEGIAIVGEHFVVQDNLELRCYYGFTLCNYTHNGAIWHPNVFIGNSVEQCITMGKLGSNVTKGTLIYIGGSVENMIIFDGEEVAAMLPIEVSNDSKYRGRMESDSLASPYNESMFESGKGTNFEQIIYPW